MVDGAISGCYAAKPGACVNVSPGAHTTLCLMSSYLGWMQDRGNRVGAHPDRRSW